ncbi:MAG: glycoside hydrolase family 3 protein [Spirochaetales bacterium]|nr:glycoside hydrolase family 3 protein [Spirochaetales bacterium]
MRAATALRARRRFLTLTAAALACALAWSCAQAHAGQGAAQPDIAAEAVPDASSFWNLAGMPVDRAAAALLATMGPDERLGQLFMLAYQGDEPTPLLYDWIRARGLGGVKIFGWNADDTGVLAESIAAIQDAAAGGPHDIPPFIATDQEGGWIRHVKGKTSVTPGNMAIGASGWPSDAYQSALYIGRELSALGITMNFAPTVDLATRPDSSIIGVRAFSSDPQDTAVLAAAFTRGLADAGVAATAKHFPGHGDTPLDSHGVLPVIEADADTVWNRELVPYRLLASEGIAGVMSGHLAYPALSGSAVPASLSPDIIQGLLRERMGYDGLVITDDLFMTGAWAPGGMAEMCERAIRAGNDILMFSRTLGFNDAAWTRLRDLYRDDSGFRDQVDRSATRVLKAKLTWLLPRGRDGIGPAPAAESALRSAESAAFFRQQAQRGATLLGTLPGDGFGRVVLAGQYGAFLEQGAAALPGAVAFRYSAALGTEPDAGELASFQALLRGADSAVVCVANAAGAAYAREVLAAGKRLAVVSVLSPVHALEFRDTAAVVAVYSYAREAFQAAFSVLSGAVPAIGRLPVRTEG